MLPPILFKFSGRFANRIGHFSNVFRPSISFLSHTVSSYRLSADVLHYPEDIDYHMAALLY